MKIAVSYRNGSPPIQSRLQGPGQAEFGVRIAEEPSAGLPGKTRHYCKRRAKVRGNILPPL